MQLQHSNINAWFGHGSGPANLGILDIDHVFDCLKHGDSDIHTSNNIGIGIGIASIVSASITCGIGTSVSARQRAYPSARYRGPRSD